MKKLIRNAGAAALCLAALASTASAAEFGHAGTLCNPATPTDASKLNYTQFGVHNVAATSATVLCGGAPEVATNVSFIGANVYDRSVPADVCCTMMVQDQTGNLFSSAVRCSVGAGAPAQLVGFFPPANAAGTVNMQCTIPGVTALGLSHVTTYRIRTP
jgi:hypothetical protein